MHEQSAHLGQAPAPGTEDGTTPNPITITALALTRLCEAMADDGEVDAAVRLKVQGGGCSGFAYEMFFDRPTDADRIYHYPGLRLVCDEMSLMYLFGTQIDFVEELGGGGFKFDNPNVKSTCGCGSSFSV